MGNGLGRVDDAAAANGEDQLRVHGDGLFHALARKAEMRVRLHAAKLLMGNACAVQQRKDLIQKPSFLRALPAVDHQHARSLAFFQLRRELIEAVRSKDHPGRNAVFK